MTPESWERVKTIFHAALDLAPEHRAAYVRDASAGDDEIRGEVESLLRADSQPASGLSRVAADYAAETSEQERSRNIGRRIGPYRITSHLGEGGMGVVYLAERIDEYQQHVAIKLVRPGMASHMVVSRFRHERQILAVLVHPNITRLLDGGATDEGQPYLVMEYVDGTPITSYSEQRGLDLRARLTLFRHVCAAVQHAHQHLVVHRDIKPGNILVTRDGTPKLMDFGIAKLLAEELRGGVAATQAGTLPMTPEYASPEQARGLPIATATDVYSLGVVLYELLTNRRPYVFDANTPSAIERVISETEPPLPSAVADGPAAKALAGDLDTIVAKAIAKEPSRRYGSVEQLSADIQRHLDGAPILARPQTLGYRASRFVRRNRLGVAAVALAFVSLSAGLAATLWQERIARQERRLADSRFNDVHELAHAFVFDFHDAIKDLPGATAARRLVVDKALQYLNKLAGEAGGDPALQRELAEAYLRVGDVQGNPGGSNLGDTEGAMQSYRRALSISEQLSRLEPENLETQRYLARAHDSVGTLLFTGGDAASAVPHYREAARVTEAMSTRSPTDAGVRQQLMSAYEALGDVSGHPEYPSLGDAKAARTAYQKARAVAEGLTADHPDNKRSRRAVGVMDMKIGDVDLSSGDVEAAIREYESAAAIIGGVSASDPLNPTTRLMVAIVTGQLAQAYEMAGRIQLALSEHQKASTLNRQLVDADPQNVQSRNSYALSLKAQADLLRKTGDRTPAMALYREALDMMRRLIAIQSTVIRRGRYAGILAALGGIAADQGQSGEARRLYREAIPSLKESADREGATFEEKSTYAEQLLTCPLSEFRDPSLAVAYVKQAVALTHGAAPKYLEQLARAYEATGDSVDAVASEEKAVALMPASSPWRQISEHKLAALKAPHAAPAAR